MIESAHQPPTDETRHRLRLDADAQLDEALQGLTVNSRQHLLGPTLYLFGEHSASVPPFGQEADKFKAYEHRVENFSPTHFRVERKPGLNQINGGLLLRLWINLGAEATQRVFTEPIYPLGVLDRITRERDGALQLPVLYDVLNPVGGAIMRSRLVGVLGATREGATVTGLRVVSDDNPLVPVAGAKTFDRPQATVVKLPETAPAPADLNADLEHAS